MSRLLLAAVIGATAVLSAAAPASAAIQCERGFQIVQGQPLATPYCQDNYLASVASEYGMRASAAEIRGNPNYKKEVCRLVGRDIRIQQACASVEPRGSRGR